MPSWLNLTTISAAVTVAAFVAEVFKAFPRYSELRRSFLLVSGGFFLGSILTAASGIQISVANSDSPFALLMAICAVGAAVFLLAAVLTATAARKAEYYWVMVGMIIAFLGLLAINAVYMSEPGSPSVGVSSDLGYDLSFSEKLLLADKAQQRRDWDRASYMLTSALEEIDAEDPRAKALNDRLTEIRALQVKSDLTVLNNSE